MGHVWDAEELVELQDARMMVATQFPEIDIKKIKLLGVGWDNTAYLINDNLVFRFPRRQIAVHMIETEAQILPLIAQFLPTPIPQPQWVGKPSGNYPWPFIGYPLLCGTTACHANLSVQERVKLAKPIANLLSTLHALPVTENIRKFLPDDLLGRMVIKKLSENSTASLTNLCNVGLINDLTPFLAAIEEAKELSDVTGSVIVHGDFYIRHLLVDQKKDLAGIIDWGDLHLGDPAVDLSIMHSIFPVEAHEIFLKEYGDIPRTTWQLSQLRAISSCARIANYGHHSKDAFLAKEGLWGLKEIAKNLGR